MSTYLMTVPLVSVVLLLGLAIFLISRVFNEFDTPDRTAVVDPSKSGNRYVAPTQEHGSLRPTPISAATRRRES